MVSGGDSQSLFAEARKTLESFRTVADNINARVGPIADNLQRFSVPGPRATQPLVNATRRPVRSLEHQILNSDENPQRLIFGGRPVKEYADRMGGWGGRINEKTYLDTLQRPLVSPFSGLHRT